MHKDLDDIKINIQSSENVLLRANGVLVISSQHQLCIIDQVHREQERSNRRIYQTYGISTPEHSD